LEYLHKHPALQFSIIALGGLVLLGYILYWVLAGPGLRPPAELAERALTASSQSEREQAAAQLAAHPEVKVELLREVWAKSNDVNVRSAIAVGLGAQRDWESMPQLIEALKDPSPLLRGRCSQAINHIVEEDFGFRANAPEEERAVAVSEIEKKWQTLQSLYQAKERLVESGSVPDKWKKRLEQRKQDKQDGVPR
jgi:hypothetical protein